MKITYIELEADHSDLSANRTLGDAFADVLSGLLNQVIPYNTDEDEEEEQLDDE